MFHDDRPYWQRHYGIRWLAPSPAIRRGCMVTLVAALAVVALVFIVAGVRLIA